ncbi:MAG: ATP-binding protein [Vicinamibacterales bacterium]
MTVPHLVRRAAFRVVAGGLVAGVLAAAGGFLVERTRFGATPAAARERIEADVHQTFTDLTARLADAVSHLAPAGDLLEAAQTPDSGATRALFDVVDAAAAGGPDDGLAVTVYGGTNRAEAWSGRPGTIPEERLTGPAALFVAPSPSGLRLVQVEPAFIEGRRVGTIVAEAPLPLEPGTPTDAGYVLQTSVVPVRLRPQFEGASDRATEDILITAGDGRPLAAVAVPADAVAAARAAFHARLLATGLLVAAATVLLLFGPLLDWRRLVREPRPFIALSVAGLVLIGVARALLYVAIRQADLDAPELVPPGDIHPLLHTVLLSSPLDFLATAFLAGATVALLAATYDLWRTGRWVSVRVVPAGGGSRLGGYLLSAAAAGVLTGYLLASYEVLLREQLSQAPVDILHFALHPWDLSRLAVAAGLVLLDAAVLGTAVLVLRLSLIPWVVPASSRWLRRGIPLIWAAGALVPILALRLGAGGVLPLPPAALALGFAVIGAWWIGRYRAWFRHASQASRLLVLFVALALPSIVFYPSLVDAANRARRQLVETRYAPEVANQRRTLQLRLLAALGEIDGLTTLPELVAAGEPVTAGPPPTDAAFLVWSDTTLETERLTSSVELYNEQGELVSRFSLKLPEPASTQSWQEASCEWEVFEEVSPFFAEERRLLHAGRAICVPGPDGGQAKVGSVVVHVTLDYGNLSFISGQNPYVALLGSGPSDQPELTPRQQVEFAVYGWSRRPLYTSGRTAWPLGPDVFDRAYASREPFWATAARGDTRYDVYYLNDRGAIYALGYPLVSPFGHLVSLAELITLVGVTFVALLTGGALFGLVAARTPASGRALLREIRASFYRKLFLAFVLAAVVPVMALAFVTRAYVASLMRADVEMEATRMAGSASRVVEDFGSLQTRGAATFPSLDDNLMVWLSRIIAQDVNVFDGTTLLASSERNLFASGLLPTRTPGDVYRAVLLEGRPSYVAQETVGDYQYLVAAAPVRVQDREMILTVPLTLRQQEIEAQIDELDRRVLLAALAFILLGAAIGYQMAERIADPVNRLTRATQRIARGDLDARIVATSSDELRRLVDAFNRMAADLQRQRGELERTNRLAAWADMARQVAHDIKNPLTPIQLNAEHLRRVHADRGNPLGDVLDECITNILTQVRLLRQIAGEFSSFASSPDPRPTRTSLAGIVEEVVEPYVTGLAGRVVFDVQVPADLPDIFVDRTLVGRAVTNIIENALHAMPAGGHLTLTGTMADDAGVRLAIRDTGVGMDADAVARIFEPYFSTKASGTGLGLTIARRNVELNRGRIEVTSERGVGTVVTLWLPVATGS